MFITVFRTLSGSKPVSVFALLVLVSVFYLGCNQPDPIGADGLEGERENPVGNIPPVTYLSLDLAEGEMPDSSSSLKVLYWWGEDPDGRITRYHYRWGRLEENLENPEFTPDTVWVDTQWVETELDSGSFILPIRTASAVFHFQVRAEDNSGAVDETPASISFPVYNSPPEVEFRLSSNPTTVVDTFFTFSTRTFVWDGYDPDGAESIDYYCYALDPEPGDTQWVELESTANAITLRDLDPGVHTFWLMASDIAGFESYRIHFPDSAASDTTASNDPRVWKVKPVVGEYLIIDDFVQETSNTNLDFYVEIFTEEFGENGFSVWEIGSALPYSSVDIVETLLFFKKIFWFAKTGESRLKGGMNSVYTFVGSEDRKMLLSTLEIDSAMVGLNNGDIGGDIPSLVDSLNVYANRMASSVDDSIYAMPQGDLPLDSLALTDNWTFPATGFYPSEGTDTIYRLTENGTWYEGTPTVGIRREFPETNSAYTVISMPLAMVNGRGNVGEVIRVLLAD